MFEHLYTEQAARRECSGRRALCGKCGFGDPVTQDDADACGQCGVQAPAIDTAKKRWAQWLATCRASNDLGGDNYLKTPARGYVLDTHPREQKNGALVGRWYRFKLNGAGELMEVGAFKIAADGVVVELPDELRDHVPGCP